VSTTIPLSRRPSFDRSAGERSDAAAGGIRCAACIWLNEQVISRIPGVLVANVNYATQRARFAGSAACSFRCHSGNNTGDRLPRPSIRPATCRPVQRREQREALGRLFVAGFGMMQVMMYAFPFTWRHRRHELDLERLFRWAGFILTCRVLYSAGPFFRGAVRDLRVRRLGMERPGRAGVAIAFVQAYRHGNGRWRGLLRLDFNVHMPSAFRPLSGVAGAAAAMRALQHLGRVVPEFAERVPGFRHRTLRSAFRQRR